ncbi:MAG TPA: hypothetical protein VIV06_09350 [Candidatus Limnocylindrales bacterium]
MIRRFGALAVLVLVVAACGGSATSAPGATQTAGAEATQAEATQAEATQAAATETEGSAPTNPPNASDLEGKARALVPDGSTEVSKLEIGGAFQLSVTTTKSLEELEAFWDQKIPSLGMTVSGKFTAGDTLTFAVTNPDGGIVAAKDSSGSGQTTIVISLGTSS